VRMLCKVVGLAPSTYYYRSVAEDDLEVRSLVEAVAAEYPRYGYRRITAQLRRLGHAVNHKRVLRIMREESLLVQVRRYVRTTWSEHAYPRHPNLTQGLEIVRPDQVWCADITYIRLIEEFIYLAVVLDVYTRVVRGWALGRHLGENLTLTALRRALTRGCPGIHHSDQGMQYCSRAYTGELGVAGARISMSATGQPTQNAYVERWIRTLKEEEVYLSDYENYGEACRNIEHFIGEVYNKKRIHSSLGYLTPMEFEAAYYAKAVHRSDEGHGILLGEPHLLEEVIVA
jgi:putative transposase